MGGFVWCKRKNVYLCIMYVRKKHNRSGSTSVVVSKASGKYKEIKSFGSSTSEGEIDSLCDKAATWIRSFGGQLAKAVIAHNDTTGEVRSGQTDVPDGFSQWLLKLDGVTNAELGDSMNYGRIEYVH